MYYVGRNLSCIFVFSFFCIPVALSFFNIISFMLSPHGAIDIELLVPKPVRDSFIKETILSGNFN